MKMTKTCANCKHSVDVGRVINDKKLYVCFESLYQKIKYDSFKDIQLNTFVPVVNEEDKCSRYEKISKTG